MKTLQHLTFHRLWPPNGIHDGTFRHSTQCRAIPRKRLNNTDIDVSSICLGTMLFGESTSEPDAHLFLDVASERGVNFFDSAEMYPVPQCAQTQGLSETIFGNWLKNRPRNDVIVSTKVAGPGGMDWIRGGPLSLDASNILQAIDGSLKRLQTDYIDILFLHWPDRRVPMFGELDYDCAATYPSVPLEEQLEALSKALNEGKIRHYGLSNETPYGLMKFCEISSTNPNFTAPIAIQNAYNLTCRTFDIALAECCHLENIHLFAYSPLAMGLLTGKYSKPNCGPKNARLNKYKGRYAEAESRYGPKPNVYDAVSAYVKLAEKYEMSPTSLALQFVLNHPLVASAVVGATSIDQLNELLDIAEDQDGDDRGKEKLLLLLDEIDEIHRMYPNPTP